MNMNTPLPPVPAGQLWIPVTDLPSALLALQLLESHRLHSCGEPILQERDSI